MSTAELAGVFGPAARAAILEVGLGRCVGCGRPDVTTQHRRARGMGGATNVTLAHPANGVPLCGDGTRGCHGWAEHHPRDAALLGWRLAPGEDPLVAPFWNRTYRGWHRWDEEAVEVYEGGQAEPVARLPYVGIVRVDEDDLDRPLERGDALARFHRWRAGRLIG